MMISEQEFERRIQTAVRADREIWAREFSRLADEAVRKVDSRIASTFREVARVIRDAPLP